MKAPTPLLILPPELLIRSLIRSLTPTPKPPIPLNVFGIAPSYMKAPTPLLILPPELLIRSLTPTPKPPTHSLTPLTHTIPLPLPSSCCVMFCSSRLLCCSYASPVLSVSVRLVRLVCLCSSCLYCPSRSSHSYYPLSYSTHSIYSTYSVYSSYSSVWSV